MTRQTAILTAALAALGLATQARAAVITNLTLYTTIDPAGGSTVDQEASGATPETTLEAQTGIKVIQDWDGWTQADAQSTNGVIISFTDPTLPDLQLKLSGSMASDGGQTGSGNAGTSDNSTTQDYVIFRNTGGVSTNPPKTLTLTIDFGNYNGSTFDGSVNSIQAAGFTVSGNAASESNSVVFYNGANVLSTQTATGGTSPDIYFGLVSGSANIDRIVLTRASTGNAVRSYFDDLAFTAIPEPSSAMLLALLGGAGLSLRRRRR